MKRKRYLLQLASLILAAACTLTVFLPCKSSAAGEKEELCEIVIENLTRGEVMPDLHAVEEAASEITKREIGCKVRIENIPIADHARRMELNGVLGTTIDIINTGRTTPFPEMVAAGMLLPLDDLLENYGPVLKEKAAALLPGCTIHGQLYCIPSNLYCSAKSGFLYNSELAERYGIVLDDIMTLQEIEQFASTLEEYGVFLTSQGDGNSNTILCGILYPQLIPVDKNNYANGVFEENNQTIRNLFETEEFLEYCQTMRKWKDNGWMPADSLISGKTVMDMFRDEELFMTWIAVNPIDKALQQKNYSFQIDMFSTSSENELTTGQIHSSGWGISSKSRNPEMAMKFLNLMYENAQLANLLMNGIEGKEYITVSEHIINYPEGVTAATVGYNRRLSSFGDTLQVYQWYPATEENYANLIEFAKSLTISPLLGYTFDLSSVQAEYNAVSGVLAEYLPPLDCGLIEDVESAVQSLNSALKQAGIDEIIRENQRQLDLWKAEQKQ